MGKMQDALRKAEEHRGRAPAAEVAQNAAAPQAKAPSPFATGTATSFALTASLRGGEVDPHLVSLIEPRSALAEQYRTLRTNLLALSPDQPLKIFVVTSSV